MRQTGNFGEDVLVRHIIGLDPGRRGIAVSERVEAGAQLVFCQRNVQAARADLTRICAEIREELEPQEQALATAHALQASALESAPHPARRIAGAVYVSCTGRGGIHLAVPAPSCSWCDARWAMCHWSVFAAGDRPPPLVWLHRCTDGVHRLIC